ncbi:hypothetical protein L2E82_25673 [Cichorium intybus]|uniref:Uncharacterized protein n=1 Tax=Cichorium intybus TaxID=13427 RepID=A0ACB9E3U0_CICIN|nr:hypothetical protein L2E82_25673 [Cichorium intybus]
MSTSSPPAPRFALSLAVAVLLSRPSYLLNSTSELAFNATPSPYFFLLDSVLELEVVIYYTLVEQHFVIGDPISIEQHLVFGTLLLDWNNFLWVNKAVITCISFYASCYDAF